MCIRDRDYNGHKSASDELPERYRMSKGPVSYTHLDVYKRQPMQWRDLVLMVEGINDEPSKRLKRLKALRKSDMQY